MLVLPGPPKKWGCSTSESHDPGEKDSGSSMSSGEFKATHGFAHNNVPLNSQNNQGPEGNFSCREKDRKPLYFYNEMYSC